MIYLGTFIEGEPIIISNNASVANTPNGFVIVATGALIDPTVVHLKYAVNGGATTTLIYGTSTNLYRTGVGLYYAQIDSTGLAGDWVAEWTTDPDGTVPIICQAIAYAALSVVQPPL